MSAIERLGIDRESDSRREAPVSASQVYTRDAALGFQWAKGDSHESSQEERPEIVS